MVYVTLNLALNESFIVENFFVDKFIFQIKLQMQKLVWQYCINDLI